MIREKTGHGGTDENIPAMRNVNIYGIADVRQSTEDIIKLEKNLTLTLIFSSDMPCPVS